MDELMGRPEWQLKNPPKYLFLGVDPNGKLIIIFHSVKRLLTINIGGGSSDLAIISMCFENNNLIFCGAETYPAKVSNMNRFLKVSSLTQT